MDNQKEKPKAEAGKQAASVTETVEDSIVLKKKGARNIKAQRVEISEGGANDIDAESVAITMGGANHIQANSVNLRQAGARTIQGQDVQVRQGGVVNLESNTFAITQGGVLFAKTGQLDMNTSKTGMVISNSDTKIDQSAVQVLISKGETTVEQSGLAILAANKVKLNADTRVVFLLARNTEGDIKTMFGPRDSALFGIITGLVAGTMLLTGKLLGLRKRNAGK